MRPHVLHAVFGMVPWTLFSLVLHVLHTALDMIPLKPSFPFNLPQGIALMNGLLTFDPAKRITARRALEHPFFQVRSAGLVIAPVPCVLQGWQPEQY